MVHLSSAFSTSTTVLMAFPSDAGGSSRGRGGGRGRGRGRGGGSSRPLSHNATYALARQKRKADQQEEEGRQRPQSIHQVYDFVNEQQETETSSSRGKVSKRAAAAEEDANFLQSQPKRRRRPATAEEEEDDESDTDSDLGGPRVGVEEPNFDEHDSDIDSDEAFGESDEERFDGWKFSGSSKRRERQEQEEDEDDEDMMDLSKMLDAADGDSDEQSGSDGEEGDSEDDALQARMADIAGTSNDIEREEEGDQDDFAELGGDDEEKVTMEDLLAPVANEKGLADFRAQARAIAAASTTRSGSNSVRASKKNAGTLAAPLPSVVQERLDRGAAYEVTKQDVHGWAPTIKRLREAEHLSFPLQSKPETKPSTAGMISSFRPSAHEEDSLERQVAQMLESGGLNEKQIRQQEELAMNKLDPEEVKQRQAELRKMRELLFRAEQKAKRVSKIKSKSYRKVHRNEKRRQQEEEGLEEPDEEQRIDAEKQRALERATLKHKNQGKWAKQMLGRDQMDASTRQAIHDQLNKGDSLRRKVQAEDSDGDQSDDSYDDDDDDARRQALEELAKPDADEPEDAQKGLLGMKFMQDARQRKRKEAEHMAAELLRDEERENEPADDNVLRIANGRAVYGGSGQAGREALQAPPAIISADESAGDNPWLAVGTSGKLSKKRNDASVSKDSSAESKAKNKMAKRKGRVEEVDDSTIDIDLDQGDRAYTEVDVSKGRALQQKDLIAEAFAGDDVAADFAEEKRAIMEAEAPKEIDDTLPGWGSWGGKGVKAGKQRKVTRTTPGLEASKRKDANMSNVIINQRRDKKADKYRPTDLPFPYTNAAQYEMVMKTPMGPEWNTRIQHQKMTLPKVVTKPGKVIKPIERRF